MKKKKTIRDYLIVIFAVLAIFFLVMGIFEWKGQQEEEKKIEELSEETEELTINERYQELLSQNSEFYGWIKIEETNIDYPVMYTPEEPNKYLHRDFEGQESVAGLPFLDARCTLESDNLILYGHNMKNKTMFQNLMNYQQKSYWEAHPVVKFDTLYEEYEYEIVAAFYDQVYQKNYEGFKFYNYIDAENEEEFNEALNYYKKQALYDTGVTAEYGDQFITLVTCSYHTENGRFVVVAKKDANS